MGGRLSRSALRIIYLVTVFVLPLVITIGTSFRSTVYTYLTQPAFLFSLYTMGMHGTIKLYFRCDTYTCGNVVVFPLH